MKPIIILFILLFNLQSFAKAEDIKEFQIGDMSIGDSLLDHFTIDDIRKEINSDFIYSYPGGKFFKVGVGESKDFFLIKDIDPYEDIGIKKESHLWLNERCETAITAKNEAQDIGDFDYKRRACAQAMPEEYQKYLDDLKAKISSLKRGSKQWWKLNRELLQRKIKCSSIPPLRHEGAWVENPV